MRYAQRYSGIAKQISERRKEERAERMKHKKDGTRNISRTLKAGTAQPLTCTKRIKPGPNKEEIDTYTMDPMEIDDNARTVWRRVYEGVTNKMHHTALNFMKKYERYIYRAGKTMQVKPLTGEDIKRVSINPKKTVAGLDHWTPEDFGMLSDEAYKC